MNGTQLLERPTSPTQSSLLGGCPLADPIAASVYKLPTAMEKGFIAHRGPDLIMVTSDNSKRIVGTKLPHTSLVFQFLLFADIL